MIDPGTGPRTKRLLAEAWSVPNALSLARIALIPAFGALWLVGHAEAALWCFAAGGATDLFDGLAARALHQQTRLGALLDPAADKLTLLVGFLVAAFAGGVPWWLAALVIGRDAVLVLGSALLAFGLGLPVVTPNAARLARFENRPRLEVHPTRIGKYATFFQLATIGFALAQRAFGSDERLAPFVAALVWISAALTAISAVQYISAGASALPRARAECQGGTPCPTK